MSIRLAHEMYLSGHLQEAETTCRQLLEKEPNSSEALHLLGVIAHEAGNNDVALEFIYTAIQADSSMPEYFTNLGVVLVALNRIDEAITCHLHAGNVYMALGRLDEALISYKRILRIQPNTAEGHYAIGGLLFAQGKLNEALARYKRAIAIKPDYIEVYNNVGCLLLSQGKLHEAAIYFQRLIGINPNVAMAYYNLGCVRIEQSRYSEAAKCFQKATVIKPDYTEAHNNLGLAYKELWRFDDAVACFQKVLELKPDNIEAYCGLGFVLLTQRQYTKAIACFRRAIELKPDPIGAYSELLMTLHYLPTTTQREAFDTAMEFGRLCEKKGYSNRSAHANHPEPGKRLKVGFVSGDLRDHVVGYFLESVLGNINPESFLLYAYATYPAFDALSERIRPFFREWVIVDSMTNEELASRIQADEIDILIDLAGHTKYNRLPVFAYKPAPLQVTWLGYFATTGIAAMDYILADRYVVPLEEEQYFVEKVWRLPDSYLCFSEPEFTVDIGALPAISNGFINFCCFNALSKINDPVIAVWARILLATPSSRLILKAVQFADDKSRREICDCFAVFGIPAERLVFGGHCPRFQVLADYNQVDIALDPFPYPGGTTTIEALWMGVPVLTLKGDRFLSHVGESILMNAGMPEWIANDLEDYVHKAAEFAQDLQKLAGIRGGLREKLRHSPVCDAPRFARNLEAALGGMWQHKYTDNTTTE